MIRRCRDDEGDAILSVVNAAAEAYRGVIPADCWHDPYMPAAELAAEMADGVEFWGHGDGRLLGVMGIQSRDGVDLIRHAYVLPASQGRGIGTRLLDHLLERARQPVLVGTWAAATWAIDFYGHHGFELLERADGERLLRSHWAITDRQIETSVVLAHSVSVSAA